MTDVPAPLPLAWLPDVTKTLTAQQRTELMQLIDMAWATAYVEQSGKADLGGAYARMSFGDVEVAHRELHARVQKDIRKAGVEAHSRGAGRRPNCRQRTLNSQRT